MGGDVTCMYTNGAEGDVSPTPAPGGSRWEMAESYGRTIGIAVAELARSIKTRPVKAFTLETRRVDLPPHKVPPGFIEITGDEYGVTQEEIEQILPVMFPSRAPLGALRVNDFEMVTFPGEPVTAIGLAVKDAMHDAGVKHPCVAALTNDLVGYILTKDEYNKGGYEVTTSFYGEDLGPLLQDHAVQLGRAVAKLK
jgi:hypothetical protein